MMTTLPETISGRFRALNQRRSSKMQRARECAELTLPGLLPPEGFGETQELTVPYSSAPGRFVSGLGSKITTQMLPLNQMPFFQLDGEGEPDTDDQEAQVDSDLAVAERDIMDALQASNLRQATSIVAEHLIVVGDCLLCERDDLTFQVYRLDQYVVQRDWAGLPYRIIYVEYFAKDHLPEYLPKAETNGSVPNPVIPSDKQKDYEAVYTELLLNADDKTWTAKSEFRGIECNPGSYKVSAYWPLRWKAMPGEDYSRSLAEENLGDLRNLDSLAKAMIEGAAASSFFFYTVDPSGYTELADVQKVLNGGVIPGRKEDISVVQPDNVQQLQATAQAMSEIIKNLAHAFLAESAVQPQGERVTAYQVSRISGDIVQTLGGPMTNLYHDVQPQIVARTIALMESQGRLPTGFTDLLKNKDMRINIKTGLEAIGREMDKAKLSGLIDRLREMPEPAQEVVEWSGFVAELFTAAGINPIGKVRTVAEQDARNAKMQQNELQNEAASKGIDVAGNAAQARLTAEQAPPV